MLCSKHLYASLIANRSSFECCFRMSIVGRSRATALGTKESATNVGYQATGIARFETILGWLQHEVSSTTRKFNNGNCKKAAPKAAKTTKKVIAPAKVTKPAAKAPAKKAVVSKAAKAIAKIGEKLAKLTARKNLIAAEIPALRDQRAVLKATPASAPAAPKVKAPAKKAAKPAAKK